jgi:hypothetical protein
VLFIQAARWTDDIRAQDKDQNSKRNSFSASHRSRSSLAPSASSDAAQVRRKISDRAYLLFYEVIGMPAFLH